MTSLAERLDMVAKDAKSVGMSFNGMLGVKFAAGRAGSDLNRTIEGIQRISEAWDKATKGEAKYLRMFRELGVDMTKDWTQAPERLYGAVTTALAGGRRSSVLEDLMGRRGMRTLNKNAANGFARDLDLARTVGIEIPQSAVDAAERLTTAQGQLSDGFMALLAKTEALTKGMDALAKLEELMMASTLAGKPLGPDSESENVYDIITRALEKDLDQTLRKYLKMTSMSMNSEDAISRYVQRMSSDEKDRLKNVILELPVQKAAEFIAKIDSRIDPKKQETWVQTRVQTDKEKAEIDRKNAIVEATALIRAGADLDEQLNKLKREQIELTQEEVDRLRETARESLSKRWEAVAGQAERDRNALSSERAKQELSLSYKMPESTLKYIEQYAEALLGEGGFGKLYNMHGGGAKEFYEAYSQGRLFTPIAEQALSKQTRGLMEQQNFSLDTTGLESAEKFVREQEELSKSYAADKAAKEKEIAATEENIAKVKQEIAATEKAIASYKGFQHFKSGVNRTFNAINAVADELPDALNPNTYIKQEELPENSTMFSKTIEKATADLQQKNTEYADLMAASIALTAAADEDKESSKKAAQAAEDMAKAADEMRKYVEFSNIDRELQARLEEAEAVELGKMLNSQVDLRKAAQDQYAIDNTAFSSRGDGKKIAEAQARAMIEAAGLTVNESSLKQLADDIYRAQNEQRKVGIQRTMQSQFYANEDFAMSQLGPRGAGMKAVADAVRQFGDALSEEQKNLIGRSAELKAMSGQNREIQRTGSQILTNDLTSRGGFRTGAVRTGHDNLQNVLENQKQQLQIFRQMDATNRRIEQLLTM